MKRGVVQVDGGVNELKTVKMDRQRQTYLQKIASQHWIHPSLNPGDAIDGCFGQSWRKAEVIRKRTAAG